MAKPTLPGFRLAAVSHETVARDLAAILTENRLLRAALESIADPASYVVARTVALAALGYLTED